jgi:hypothetical protein
VQYLLRAVPHDGGVVSLLRQLYALAEKYKLTHHGHCTSSRLEYGKNRLLDNTPRFPLSTHWIDQYQDPLSRFHVYHQLPIPSVVFKRD